MTSSPCHLALRLLDGAEPCGSCGHLARSHKAHRDYVEPAAFDYADEVDAVILERVEETPRSEITYVAPDTKTVESDRDRIRALEAELRDAMREMDEAVTRGFADGVECAARLVDSKKRRATFTDDAGTMYPLIDQHVTANEIRELGEAARAALGTKR